MDMRNVANEQMTTRTRRAAARAKTQRTLGMTGRGMVFSGLLAAAVLGAGALGALYVHNHSPNHLANVAQISIQQRDYDRAIGLLVQAMAKDPTGPVGIRVRDMLAQCYIQKARETDARALVEQSLALDPTVPETQQLLVDSYSAKAQRIEYAALKPITREAGQDILAAADEGRSGLLGLDAKYQGTARFYLALAEIESVESRTLTAIPALKTDDTAAAHTAAAIKDAAAAYNADPTNAFAAQRLVELLYGDKQYGQVLAVANKIGQGGTPNSGVAVLAAKATLEDVKAIPDAAARRAAAEKRLNDFLVAKPDSPEVLAELGEIALDENDYAKAEDLAHKALAIAPKNMGASMLLGLAQLKSGAPQDAVKTLEPLTSAAANIPQVWYLLGVASSDAGAYSDADDHLKKALLIQPDFADAKRAMLSNDLRSGNSEAAASLATQLIESDKYFVPAWAVRAESLRRAGNRAEATEKLQDLASDPNLPQDEWPDLVQALLSNDDMQTARTVYGRMVASAGARGGTDPVLQRTASLIDTYAGKFTAARAALESAIKNDPENIDLRIQLAQLLLNANYRLDARQQLDAGAKLAKGTRSATGLSKLAEAYLDLDLPDQAKAMAQSALEIQPNAEAANMVLAQAAALTGSGDANTNGLSGKQAAYVIQLAVMHRNFDTALRLARIAMQKEPGDVSFHLLAAQALAGMDQFDAAADELVAAAERAPMNVAIYNQMVQIFNTPANAAKGIPQAQRMALFNAPLASWAAGELSTTLGQFDKAAAFFDNGLRNVTREMPATVKSMLYSGQLNLAAAKGDQDAYVALAESIAQDAQYALLARLTAADYLIARNRPDVARQELDKINASGYPARAQAVIARYYGIAGDPQHGIAMLQGLPTTDKNDPNVMALSATLYEQANQPALAVKISQALVDSDPTNAAYLERLAQVKSAAHDFPGAFDTLKQMGQLGPSPAFRASSLRVKLLASLGLVEPAMQELQNVAATTQQDDFTNELAVGQIWAQLNRPDLAKATLTKIPSYAPEYVSAQLALADSLADSGQVTDAMAMLKGVIAANPRVDTQQLNISLFHMALLADRPDEALAIADTQRKAARANSLMQRQWTIFAATAARDGGKYDDALALLQGLPDQPGAGTAVDRVLLNLIQDRPRDAATIAATLPADDNGLKTFVALLQGQPASASAGADGKPGTLSGSATLALLAGKSGGWDDAIKQLTNNSAITPTDLQALASSLNGNADAQGVLKKLALAQMTLEMQWPEVTIRLCDAIKQSAPDLALADVLKCSALREAKKDQAADDLLATLTQKASDLPSVRLLVAQRALATHQYQAVLTQLKPLAGSNSTSVLALLAKAEEKLGALNESIALTRQLRAIAPDQVVFANDLAYRLAISAPNDPATISAAQEQINVALAHAPAQPAFADTAGLIALLENQPQKAAQYLTAAILPLRLSPAVHLHLGLTYARLNLPELARLHLRSVAVLAGPAEKDSLEVHQAEQALSEMVAQNTK
jgi:tetratricopeptide (TPR) repeat protein